MPKQKKHSNRCIPAFFAAMLVMILAVVVFSVNKQAELADSGEDDASDICSTSHDTSGTIPQPTPTPSPDEDNSQISGLDQPLAEASGVYLNQAPISVATGYGRSISIGIDLPSHTDAIYINPHFEYEYAGNPMEDYCFLLETDRVPLEYAYSTPGTVGSFPVSGITDYAIRGRTNDKVVPAAWVDAGSYGVRWKDYPGIGGKEHDGDTIRILAIRVSDGTLMGAGRATIAYDPHSQTYQISSLRNADVSETGELSGEQREQLIRTAFDFLLDGNANAGFGVNEDQLEAQRNSIVVERSVHPYYNILYNKKGEVIHAATISNCTTYAVNINHNSIGYFTVYFAPKLQLHGFQAEKTPGQDCPELVIVGYDAFAPMTVETFNSFIFPDDVDVFGAAKY